MLANYHTHTIRCKHAKGTEREYIEAAIKKGFKILGFSDHVPFPYPNGFVSTIRMDMNELENYVTTLLDLRKEYKNDIDILIGFETEYQKRYLEPLYRELANYPIDYMLLGQHFVEDEIHGIYSGDPCYDEKGLSDYVNLCIEGMKTGLFAYLAHPDLFHFAGDETTYLKHMKRLIQASIDMDFLLEINIHGFLERRHYPGNLFFKTASDMGARFIIGCDAHDPSVIVNPEDISLLYNFIKINDIKYGNNILQGLKKPFYK
ncbi:MAG: histidinol-phosphatase [Lachnospiraceae bacterium]|nr:histidinol-phosphatase [Lachnospiraceae bacterium]